MRLFFILIFVSLQLSAAIINVVNNNGCTLRDAIRAANADATRGDCSAGSGSDIIRLPDDYFVLLSSDLPTITTAMEITTHTNAGQALIDGNNSHRPFKISGTTNVILSNLRMTNGLLNSITNNGGAGILITGSEVELNNVKIDFNNIILGLRQGGGARVINSTLTMENCTFLRNGIEGLATLGKTAGANLALINSSANINNSTIKGYENQAAYFDSVLNRNTSDLGPGIYMDNSDATISNSLFTKQSGAQGAEGTSLYLKNGSVAFVSNTTFFHDNLFTVSTIQLESSQIHINNSTIFSGGFGNGIVVNSGQVFLSNSYLVDSDPDVVDFCTAIDGLGNVINFPLSLNVNNMFPPDQSCENVSQIYSDKLLIRYPRDNGGPTHTARLRPYSSSSVFNPAIGSGDPNTCEATDQRGVLRSANCDIGAYEVNDTADLAIDMNLITTAPYYLGQTIEYHINVQNLGPADVFGVNVSLGDSGLFLDHFQTVHNCFTTGFGASCEIGDIANGGNVLIKMFMAVTGPAIFDADAIVQLSTDFSEDTASSNNTDNTGNGGSLVPAADLKITQTLLTSAPYFIGQQLNYQLEVENLNGSSQAVNIEITHPTLLGSSAVSHTGCDSNTLSTCTINSLSNGTSRSFNFHTTVTGAVIKTSAEVSADTYDPFTINNRAANSNNTETDSDLKISMVLTTPAPYHSSDIIQYSIFIQNGGPDIATNISLENIAENMVLIGGDSTCEFLPCNIPVLALGDTINIVLTGTIFASGSFFNSMFTSSDQNDDDQSNNSVTIQKSITPDADVEVIVSLTDSSPYYLNEIIEIELLVRNNGIISATQIDVISSTLNNLLILDVSSPNCVSIPCTLPTLEVGANNAEIINVTARITGIGPFNLAIIATANEFDQITSNNNDSTSGIASANPTDFIFIDGFEN